MPRVFLLNTDEFPCPGSHLLHTRKFLRSFEYFGFEFREADSWSTVLQSQPSPADIFYFSNHGIEADALSGEQMHVLEQVKKAGSFPIFWFWHSQEELLNAIFGERWILTGEHYRANVVRESHQFASEAFRSSPNFIPLTFAAALTKEQILGVQRGSQWDATFIGHHYKRRLNASLLLSPHKIAVRYTPPFISEEKRVSYFTNTLLVLGWHSSGNIANGVVVERVFEGLAYGAAVVTDNPFALEATDGNAIFATDRAEILALIERFKRDQQFWNRVSKSGQLWAADYGTYQSVTQRFLSRIIG
jgi:hypothetical protein